jgi:hypothetical protein
MRLFRVFIRAQSEFLFRCYPDPIIPTKVFVLSPLMISMPVELSVTLVRRKESGLGHGCERGSIGTARPFLALCLETDGNF